MVAMINIGDWVNPLLPGTKCTVLMPINWETITDHSSHLFQYSEIHQKFPVYSLFEMCVAKASFFFFQVIVSQKWSIKERHLWKENNYERSHNCTENDGLIEAMIVHQWQ